MNSEIYTKIISDKNFSNLKKMEYKYSKKEVSLALSFAKKFLYQDLNLLDFKGHSVTFIPTKTIVPQSMYIKILNSSGSKKAYGINSMEDEVYSTLLVENIQSTRNSVRNILNNLKPQSDEEHSIYAMKKALDFISDKKNTISEENLFALYSIAISDFLEDDDKLEKDNFYRHDKVFVTGSEIYHKGLEHKLLPPYMKNFIDFINDDTDNINYLVKSAIIHFYFCYLHPYFDGNGRMARLLHLWFLIQAGFSSTLFTSFSKFILKTKSKYYTAFELVEENYTISKMLDVTPFLEYFSTEVYEKLEFENDSDVSFEIYDDSLSKGLITEKETKLWAFILVSYAEKPFSTKQLEKDFSDVAYATVRNFVLKFERLGLLISQKFSNRVKYQIKF